MIITLKQFRKQEPGLKGKKIILCEHLKDKSIDNVVVNLWIGSNTRLLLCPICEKVHRSTVWDAVVSSALFVSDMSRKLEVERYGKWLEEAGKENNNASQG